MTRRCPYLFASRLLLLLLLLAQRPAFSARTDATDAAASSTTASAAGQQQQWMKYIDECMQNNTATAAAAAAAADESTTSAQKKKSKKQSNQWKQKKPFFLFFGGAAVEAFNAIDAQDAANIRQLAQCVQRLLPTHDASTSASVSDTDGDSGADADVDSSTIISSGRSDASASDEASINSSSTEASLLLTGVFQYALPELHAQLLSVMQQAARKAEWHHLAQSVPLLGVRSVQLLSQQAALDTAQHFAATRRRASERDSTRGNFVIFPNEAAKREHEQRVLQQLREEDPDTDEAVLPHLRQGAEMHGTSFTALLLLSDRSEFAGGDVLARNSRSSELEAPLLAAFQHASSSSDSSEGEEGDGDDDSSSSDEDGSDRSKFEDGLYYQLARYTPEQFSLLLVHGAYGFGAQPTRAGARTALLLELWPFEDFNPQQQQQEQQQQSMLPQLYRPLLHEATPLSVERIQQFQREKLQRRQQQRAEL